MTSLHDYGNKSVIRFFEPVHWSEEPVCGKNQTSYHYSLSLHLLPFFSLCLIGIVQSLSWCRNGVRTLTLTQPCPASSPSLFFPQEKEALWDSVKGQGLLSAPETMKTTTLNKLPWALERAQSNKSVSQEIDWYHSMLGRYYNRWSWITGKALFGALY